MRSFEDYLNEGVVKTIKKDRQRANSLVIEAERKISSLKESIEKIGIRNDNANDYIEHCYDAIMFLVRAKLFLDGYLCSGQGAHEAEVSFMANLGFSERDIDFADKLRYFRNSILYYGKQLDAEYAKKVIEFTKKIYPKLKDLIK